MSRFWLHLFASVLLFSGSHLRFLLSIFRPSSSLVSSSTSSQPSVVPPSTEPQDSQRTVDEVAAGATKLSGDGAAADLVALEVTVAMAVGSSEGLALASWEIALVVPSSPRPTSPSPSLTSGGPPFADDVVQQFDATHRLSELTAAWGSLSSLATSFEEKLQVSFFTVPSLDVRFSLVLILCFSLYLFAQSFSHDHTGFFFSSKNEKSCLQK